jgi:hypothetical protein
MASKRRDERLNRKAVELVRHAYQIADGMRNVDLAALNGGRPPTRRYQAQHDLVREFLERADAMLDFAGKLDLIDSDEPLAILLDVAKDHAELDKWLADEDKRLVKEP